VSNNFINLVCKVKVVHLVFKKNIQLPHQYVTIDLTIENEFFIPKTIVMVVYE